MVSRSVGLSSCFPFYFLFYLFNFLKGGMVYATAGTCVRSESSSLESFHCFHLCVYSKDHTQFVRFALLGSNCLHLLRCLADSSSFGVAKVLVFMESSLLLFFPFYLIPFLVVAQLQAALSAGVRCFPFWSRIDKK